MKRSFRVEQTYPHPVEKVWKALTEAEALSEWLMPTTDFAPEVGHTFELRTKPGPGFDGIVRCQVLAVDAPRSMRWAWKGGPVDTVVSFRLESLSPASTRLSMTQSGFVGAKGVFVSYLLSSGARRIYGRELRGFLAARDGATPWQPRRSAWLSMWHEVIAAAVRAVPHRKVGR